MLTIAPAQMHSATSMEAAEKIVPHMNRLRIAVMSEFARRGSQGATDEEIQDYLGLAANTERPRRIELWDMGLIRDSGTMRKTRSGRNARVWVVA